MISVSDSLLPGGVIVAILATATATALALSERRARKRLLKEKETLLDNVWELKAAASALDKAEAANEAKSRFLAMVSHEVRTPLTGVLGMTELLMATELSAEQLSYIDAIRLSADSLASLINEILDFSKIEAGKLDLNRASFDLPALVEGIAELLAPRAQGKGIEIATSIERNVPRRVMGDPERLRQILMNLAGNAIKFTERGGVGLALTRSSSDRVRFSVCDSGPGVPLDRREFIFQEFEQADASPARKHEGTGLGLTISRALVELMGGELVLERSGPEGSVFSFDISLPEVASAPEHFLAPADLSEQKVLLVADTTFGSSYLRQRLREMNAFVECARSETEALDTLQKHVFNLAIIDCAIGERSSECLAVAARARGVRRILVLFSPFERRAFGDALMKEFDGWLVKPVRLKSLFSQLGDNGEAGMTGEAGPAPPITGAPLKGRSILLAEDNDINALLVDRHLARLGARVTRAHNGADAIAMACENLGMFDAILMDMRMPGVDGLAATKTIRSFEKKAAAEPVRIIALTANVSEEDRAAALEAGMDRFLAKPIDLLEMMKALTPG